MTLSLHTYQSLLSTFLSLSYKYQATHTQQMCIAAEQGEMKCECVSIKYVSLLLGALLNADRLKASR